jgi:hypothetical protein
MPNSPQRSAKQSSAGQAYAGNVGSSSNADGDLPPQGTQSHGSGTDQSSEPPVVQSTKLKPDYAPLSELSKWLEDNLGTESYGAPRVFDLYTLLAVTLAFALMFACLRLIEPLLLSSLPQVAIALGIFVTLIAIAQLALWGGNKPRLASIVAGPAIWFVIALGLTAQNPRQFLNPAAMAGLLCSSILGVFAGYLGGGMVAGVFLLADAFRKQFVKPSKEEDEPDNDDFIFDDR